ncbi:uncharacterized protein LOC129263531 [Lytechinus pictus]|uniref:uncharacterized protein LOC129263531 n=1 Tax=Lytechinus pictus TaxID=7653 RepID=UPI0030BA0C41
MGIHASKGMASASKSRGTGRVTAEGSPVTEGQVQRDVGVSDGASPEETRVKRAVEKEAVGGQGTAAVNTASPQESPDELNDDEHRLPNIRNIFVQYVTDKPYAVTYFGARLHSHDCRHVIRDIDGSGLAYEVGLRNHDELLSINNIETDLTNTIQLAVLECLADIGTRIGLVIKRKEGQDEQKWLYAFHLNEKDGRPNVETISRHLLDSGSEDNSFIELLPVETAFDVTPTYQYRRSAQVELIERRLDRFTEIGRTRATYVSTSQNVTLNYYQVVGGGNPPGNPIAISQPVSSSRPMCIEGVIAGPLDVVAFPRWMRDPRTQIPQNNMFFFVTLRPTGSTVIKAANTNDDLYMTTENMNREWIASLGRTASEFRIVPQGGSACKSTEETPTLVM